MEDYDEVVWSSFRRKECPYGGQVVTVKVLGGPEK